MKIKLEQSLIRIFIYFSIGYQLIQLAYDFMFTQYVWFTQLENIATVLLYLLVLHAGKQNVRQRVNPYWVVMIATLSLSFEWVIFGGFSSTMPYSAFLLMMIIIICCRGRLRILCSSLFFLLLLILLYLDHSQVLPVYDVDIYPSALTLMLDFLLHALLITLLTLLLKQKFDTYRSGIVRNNEKLRALDQELAQKNEKLAHQQAKIQLLNIDLEKMIEQEVEKTKEKNRKLAEYAYINAHHLRGPLCRIMGLTYLMTETTPENPQLPHTIKKRAEELDKIIKQINKIVS